MFSQRVSLAVAMKLVALVAVDLALLRVLPAVPQSPILLFTAAMINVLIVQLAIVARPISAFQTTFFVVGLVASIVLSVLTYVNAPPGRLGSLRIVTSLVWLWHQVTGEPASLVIPYIPVAERCVTSALGIVLAWAAGLGVAHLQCRQLVRPSMSLRRIALFVQGMVIGLAIFSVLVAVDAAMRPVPSSATLRWWGLAACLLVGGGAVAFLGGRKAAGAVNQP